MIVSTNRTKQTLFNGNPPQITHVHADKKQRTEQPINPIFNNQSDGFKLEIRHLQNTLNEDLTHEQFKSKHNRTRDDYFGDFVNQHSQTLNRLFPKVESNDISLSGELIKHLKLDTQALEDMAF